MMIRLPMSLEELEWRTREEALAAPRFPHYKDEEVAVMKRWLLKHDDVKRIAFTILFPPPEDVLEDFIDGILEEMSAYLGVSKERLRATLTDEEIWQLVYRRSLKADALADMDDYYYLIEIKDKPRPSALGQLLTYQSELERCYIVDKPVRLLLVAWLPNPQVERVLVKRGVLVELV